MSRDEEQRAGAQEINKAPFISNTMTPTSNEARHLESENKKTLPPLRHHTMIPSSSSSSSFSTSTNVPSAFNFSSAASSTSSPYTKHPGYYASGAMTSQPAQLPSISQLPPSNQAEIYYQYNSYVFENYKKTIGKPEQDDQQQNKSNRISLPPPIPSRYPQYYLPPLQFNTAGSFGGQQQMVVPASAAVAAAPPPPTTFTTNSNSTSQPHKNFFLEQQKTQENLRAPVNNTPSTNSSINTDNNASNNKDISIIHKDERQGAGFTKDNSPLNNTNVDSTTMSPSPSTTAAKLLKAKRGRGRPAKHVAVAEAAAAAAQHQQREQQQSQAAAQSPNVKNEPAPSTITSRTPKQPKADTGSKEPSSGGGDRSINYEKGSRKPFKCAEEGCNWSFARLSDLKRHKKSHAPPEFQCPYWRHDPTCHRNGGAFNRLDVLKRHLKLVHYIQEKDSTLRGNTPPVSDSTSGSLAASAAAAAAPPAPKILTAPIVESASPSYLANEAGWCRSCQRAFTSSKDFLEHVPNCAANLNPAEWNKK